MTMKRKSHPQKNTLLKNTASPRTTIFFKRVFISPTQEEIQIIFFPTLRFFNYLFFHRTLRNWTDTASIVGNFGQSVCKLDTTHLRTDRRATDNKGLKEMAGEVVNQTFVLLINGCGRLTVRASKPPLL
jgi:hypothetical protein